jgi:hypothetical protein
MRFWQGYNKLIKAKIFHHLSMVHTYHDIGHYCYTRNHLLWSFVARLGAVLTGLSDLIWIHRHSVGHHSYT